MTLLGETTLLGCCPPMGIQKRSSAPLRGQSSIRESGGESKQPFASFLRCTKGLCNDGGGYSILHVPQMALMHEVTPSVVAMAVRMLMTI